jgi:crotonobetainyl-CoA:carnitine CoA-transferase CaiB-like acyl-CoA transferase
MPMQADRPTGPLAGLLVADFSRVLAGPYATMLLGDLGATVIKVESPAGDDTRRWGPPWVGGESAYFQSINRNKRSLVLDLTDPADQAAARRLGQRADVLFENFKTGRADRLGIGYEQLRPDNPALIYCSITGYGSGAGAHLPAYDLIIQAVSGLASLTGPDAETPTKTGIPVTDVITGLHAATGVLAALHHRHRTGQGQRLELNLLSSTLSGMVNFTGTYVLSGEIARAMGMRHPSICPYEPYPTADRLLIVAAGNQQQFARLCKGLDLPELVDDPRFATNQDRIAHRQQLNALLSGQLRRRTAAEWEELLGAAGVPCGPINDLAEAIALADRLGLSPVVDVAGVPQVASPFEFSRTPVSYRQPPPRLGDDTDELRGWLGADDQPGKEDS